MAHIQFGASLNSSRKDARVGKRAWKLSAPIELKTKILKVAMTCSELNKLWVLSGFPFQVVIHHHEPILPMFSLPGTTGLPSESRDDPVGSTMVGGTDNGTFRQAGSTA